jgi:outer membrane protein assembly factor BamB
MEAKDLDQPNEAKELDLIKDTLELDVPWYHTRFMGRLLSAFFPPLGFLLLWTHPLRRRSRKILGTVLLAGYFVCWLAGLGALGLQMGWFALDWDGGDLPRLVLRRSGPNYQILEQDRTFQAEERARKKAAFTNNVFAARAPYWTDFRGPKRDGHYDEEPILTRWPARGLRQLWRYPCGGGYASFVVADGLAFTIEQRWDTEVVVAYDLATGREVWTHAYTARFYEWMGGEGPRATPTFYADRVYSLGAQGDLLCLGARTGTLIWRRNVLEDTRSENLRYGLAASPIVVDEQLIVQGGQNGAEGTVAGYDVLTGDLLWTALPEQLAYASPLRARLADTDCLMLVTATRVVGMNPADQTVLWETPWAVRYGDACCLPVIVDDRRFFLGGGYGAGSRVVEVRREGTNLTTRVVWQNRNLRTKFNPAVYHEGHLYGLDEGVLTCVDATTGERCWRGGRFGYGQLLLASGELIVLGGNGRLALVEATPEAYRALGSQQALHGKTWNVPALAHGRLLLRNSEEMVCYQIGKLVTR